MTPFGSGGGHQEATTDVAVMVVSLTGSGSGTGPGAWGGELDSAGIKITDYE